MFPKDSFFWEMVRKARLMTKSHYADGSRMWTRGEMYWHIAGMRWGYKLAKTGF